MHLTKFSDYSLRVLIYLATMEGEKTTAQAIADAYGISFHHVAKACQWLVRHDYIESERGRNGGISLIKSAAEINIGDLVEATETGSAVVECLKPAGGECCISPACGLRLAIAEAEAAFMASLRNFTLESVVSKRSALQQLLANTETAI